MRFAKLVDQNPWSLGESCMHILHRDIKRGAMFCSTGTGNTAVEECSVDHKQLTIYMQHVMLYPKQNQPSCKKGHGQAK